MSRGRAPFAAIGILAIFAGTVLWWLARPGERASPPAIAPAALLGTQFRDIRGATHSLGEFQGQVLVLNFWATWCAPCREEMPAFERLQQRWAAKGVRFVGLSEEEPAQVASFADRLGIRYALWVGDEARELGRRLGNRSGVLPYTVVLDRHAFPKATKVGAYSEVELEELLGRVALPTP